MWFSRKEYWSGLSFPPPRDLPDPEVELESPAPPPALAGRFFFIFVQAYSLPLSHQWYTGCCTYLGELHLPILILYSCFPRNQSDSWKPLRSLYIIIYSKDKFEDTSRRRWSQWPKQNNMVSKYSLTYLVTQAHYFVSKLNIDGARKLSAYLCF